jgi:glycosyltransferase involved in cell wall biosynthesis
MRVAVVVPFHDEREEWLRCCFQSVAEQQSPAAIIAVGDGATPNAVGPFHRLIQLPEAHRDGGRAARAIGASEAVNSGFDAVAFLDADNWFSPLHIAEMLRLHATTGASICTASLSIVRVDGRPFEPELPSESDGETHADTSTIFVTREAFPLLSNWALVPPELGSICDRVWWQLAKSSGYKRAHSTMKTVFYRNRYAEQYRVLGETPPAGTKEFSRPQVGRYSIRVPAMSVDCEITPYGVWNRWSFAKGES